MINHLKLAAIVTIAFVGFTGCVEEDFATIEDEGVEMLQQASLEGCTTTAFLHFENTSERAERDGADLVGDNAWFEATEFEFGARRDIATGARPTDIFSAESVRATVPDEPRVIELMRALKEGNDTKLSIHLFTNHEGQETHGMTFVFDNQGGTENTSSGRIAGVRIINVVEVSDAATDVTAHSAEPLVALHYAYHSVSCEDLIRSKAATWSWATRTQ